MAFLGEEMRAHPEAVESRGGFERFSQAALRCFVATVAVVLSAQCVSAQALKITDFETVVKPFTDCLLYTSPSPRDQRGSRMPSSA